jgi:TetR/AcrR family transcriptional repressor of nem operon
MLRGVSTTRERILDSAQALAQLRGYNGFSYADISAELAISKPSVHHHFPAKADLAGALVTRYRERFDAARDELDDPGRSARRRLTAYAGLYAEVFTRGGRMCLCGVFAADASSLPPAARAGTDAFFADQRRWVAGVLRGAGVPAPRARRSAEAYLAGLEGALLLARAAADPQAGLGTVERVSATLLDALL